MEPELTLKQQTGANTGTGPNPRSEASRRFDDTESDPQQAGIA